MKDILPLIKEFLQANKPFALATVTKTWGSSPRPIGSIMAVTAEMEMAGSVSGGCVEGAVVTEGIKAVADGQSRQLAYGVADEDAWSVGLSCGGKIQVFLERAMAFSEEAGEKAVWEAWVAALEGNQSCVLLTCLKEGAGQHALLFPEDGRQLGSDLSADLVKAAHRAYNERHHVVVEEGGAEWFVQVFPRKSQLLIIGAAHITVDLVALAKLYDFETIVIDPRKVFLHKTQFREQPDRLIAEYPDDVLTDFQLDAYTYAAVLSHDPKIDDPALQLLLKSKVAYIGGLGSRKTQAKRRGRLEAAGFSDEEIRRIHAPVGVSINAKKPREIALSIMAEIIQVQNQYI